MDYTAKGLSLVDEKSENTLPMKNTEKCMGEKQQVAYSALEFRSIPKILNASGSSMSSTNTTFTNNITDSPYSIITQSTSLSDSPLPFKSFDHINPKYSPEPSNLPSPRYKGNFTPLSLYSKRKRVKENIHRLCSFCTEPLSNVFEGEKLVDLTCGDVLHLECLREIRNPLESNNSSQLAHKPIVCPKCNTETSCVDSSIMTFIDTGSSLHPSTDISSLYKNALHPGDKMEDIINSLSNFKIPSLKNFNFDQIELNNNSLNSPNWINYDQCNIPSTAADTIHNEFAVEENDENETINPITPQSQVGMNFWEKNSDTESLQIKTPPESTFPNNTENTIEEIELAEVLFSPEFSSIDINETSSLNCVVNFSTTEFENSLGFDKKEEIKTRIGKNKLTNNVIHNFQKNNINIDFSNVGSLVVFDFIDVNINLHDYKLCQIYLFESNIIILNSEGNKLILNQEFNTKTFISSIYKNEKQHNIIINLNSIKISSITLVSSNKILTHKWFTLLSKMCDDVDVSNLIPLVQVSTNAWNLIVDDDAIPKDIKIFKQLSLKGLDLPSRFLKKQVLRPETLPVSLIVVIPLINYEDYGLEDEEFANQIKLIITEILHSLHSKDKLGIVFLGDHINKVSTLGNYYGCIHKNWEGWNMLLNSIDASIISDNEGNFKWGASLRYLEILSNIAFSTYDSKKTHSINQIIFISNELITKKEVKSPMKHVAFFDSTDENPFLITEQSYHHDKNDLSYRVSELCDKFDCNFNVILFADEFRYEPFQIFEMNKYLKMNTGKTNNNALDYENSLDLSIALDFNQLIDSIKSTLRDLHLVTIKKLETSISFPKYVSLNRMESTLGIIETNKTDTVNKNINEYKIILKNLPSGYEKSFLLNIPLKNNEIKEISGNKLVLAKSQSVLTADKLTSTFCNEGKIKIVSGDSNIQSDIAFSLNVDGSETESVRRSSQDDGGLNLSIFPRLSSVGDIYYVKRSIVLLIKEKIHESVLNIRKFDSAAKEHAKETLGNLKHEIWALSNSCNTLENNSYKENTIGEWTNKLIEKIDDIIDGYSLRNYQLSNMKCVILYLALE